MATKPTNILNKYLVRQIYTFEKHWPKNPTGYMFIQNIEQDTMLRT